MNEKIPTVVLENRKAFSAYSEKVSNMRKFLLLSQIGGSLFIGTIGALFLLSL